MASIDVVAEKRFRDEEVEKTLLAYILRVKPMLATKVEARWFGSVMFSNIVRVAQDVKALLPKAALYGELGTRKMIGKSEKKLYAEALDEIYSVSVNRMNDKSAEITRKQVISMFEGRSILYGVRDMVKALDDLTVDDMKYRMKELGSGVKLKEEILSGDYIKSFEGRVEKILEKQKIAAQGRSVGIGTGIRMFDYMVGGLMPSEFGVIAGQPGVGKSATLASFGLTAWRNGYNVLFVTGEMPKHDIEFRMDADVAGISATKFRFGNLSDQEMRKWKSAIEREKDLRDSYLEVVSFPRNFTAADIEGHALQIQEQYGQPIHLICLDYLNIMNANTSKSGSKDWKEQAEVVWDVKSLCADMNGGISLWTAGQVKDEAIDAETLSLEDLKYARAISETAPVVIGLVRSQDAEAEGIIELQVMKMRNAPLPTNSIILRPNLEFMRIHQEIVPKTKSLLEVEDETKRKAVRKREPNRRSN